MITGEALLYYKANRLEVPPVVLPEHLWIVDKKGKPKSPTQREQEAADFRFLESLRKPNRK